MYAMITSAMRTVLAWCSPDKGNLTSIPLSESRMIRQFGRNILEAMVKDGYVTIQNGRVFPTKGGRAAFDEAPSTGREGDETLMQLERIKAVFDRHRSIQDAHLFS